MARNIVAWDDSLTIMDEFLDELDYAYMTAKTQKGEVLKTQIDDFVNRLQEDGTLVELQKKWFDGKDLETIDIMDYSQLKADNGTLTVALFQCQPFSFLKENGYGGYDVEILALFCQEQGMALEIVDANVDGVLPLVQSEKCQIGAGGFTVTEERKESVLFSNPTYTGGTALMVIKDAGTGGATEGGGFIDNIKESFNKTFIREDRWKLFVFGIGTTLLITVMSVILGTILGFAAFMACRNGNPFANGITKFSVWLIQGTPVVVLLMIFYYIVFSKLSIPGTAVSIIVFTLLFGAAVYSMLKVGIGAIDPGQMEAAYALGYSDRKAFFRVVLPQAWPHIMRNFKGQIVSLIKATAIVGYVAVQDLTKMGDIVRSRTYEAFFPLISVAIIYFALAGILTFVVNKIEFRIDPRHRSEEDILKGVNFDD